MSFAEPEPLAAHHLTDEFESGVASLDDWLKRRARANQASGASRTIVATDGSRVIGYYSLASSSITHHEAAGSFRRNMPDPVPVVTLGRLAIDLSYQGRGYGGGMLKDASKRVLTAADLVGIRGMIVHAISDEARDFYLKNGFVQSPISELTLMIPLSAMRENL